MNLADAIRKAANKGLVEVEPVKPAPADEKAFVEAPKARQEDDNVKKEVQKTPIEIPSTPPEPPSLAMQGGNAVRLEIFLNGEQMAGMLKAIMAGQHSVLTVREAATYLRVSPKTIEKLAEDGEIPAVEIDGRYRFPKSNLDDWLANQSAEHEEEKDVA